MKRLISVFLCASVVILLGLEAQSVSADSYQTVSDSQIEHIKQNCIAAQSTLTQLQKSDTLLRINFGQQYEFIAGKLIAPLNGRLVINQMSVGNFITTATTFQQQINSFRIAYTTYGESLGEAVSDDCQKNPQQFYNDVVTARTNRQAVQSAVADLSSTLGSYGSQVDVLANNIKATAGN